MTLVLFCSNSPFFFQTMNGAGAPCPGHHRDEDWFKSTNWVLATWSRFGATIQKINNYVKWLNKATWNIFVNTNFIYHYILFYHFILVYKWFQGNFLITPTQYLPVILAALLLYVPLNPYESGEEKFNHMWCPLDRTMEELFIPQNTPRRLADLLCPSRTSRYISSRHEDVK